MIFDLLTHPHGPRGRGKMFLAFAHPMHESNSHTKFGLIGSNGLGGDSITNKPPDQFKFWTPKYPQIPLLGHDPGD